MSAITSPNANIATPALPEAKFHLHAKSAKEKTDAPATGQVPAGEPAAGLFSSILQAVGLIAKL